MSIVNTKKKKKDEQRKDNNRYLRQMITATFHRFDRGPSGVLDEGQHCPLQRGPAIVARRWHGLYLCAVRIRPNLVGIVGIFPKQLPRGAGRPLLSTKLNLSHWIRLLLLSKEARHLGHVAVAVVVVAVFVVAQETGADDEKMEEMPLWAGSLKSRSLIVTGPKEGRKAHGDDA